MIQAGTLDITAPRHVPLVYLIDFDSEFTETLDGATLDMHVRLLKDNPGSPLINLNPAAAGSQGLSMDYDAETDTTTVVIQINQATMKALPPANEIGEDLELWWDLHVTPDGGTKAVYLRGKFIVQAGVTS